MRLGLNRFSDKLKVKFEHVWQDGKNLSKSKPLMMKIREEFEESGFNVGTDDVHFRHVCYADSPNSTVINYNGDVFKCTARDFSTKSREGILNANGHIEWNEKFKRRMEIRYGNKACRECIILPLCNGSCTQNKLESKIIDACYVGMGEDDKAAYLKARVKELAKNKIKEQIKKRDTNKKAILPNK